MVFEAGLIQLFFPLKKKVKKRGKQKGRRKREIARKKKERDKKLAYMI